MYVQVKSSSGISLVPLESRLMSSRRVFLSGEINRESADELFKQVMLLNTEASDKPIDLLINSPGGEVDAGLMIYDVIQSSPAPIRVICVGMAYSMAAVLFAGGNHGRYMLPHAKLMLHEPLLGNRVGGNCSSIRSISESLLKTKRDINRILAHHTGRSEEEVEKASEFDHYFTPQESMEFGLCDGIMTFGEITETAFPTV